MEKIIDILTDFEDEDDVRDLWEKILHHTKDNKCARNLILGFPKKGDTLLWQQIINKECNTMGWAKEKVYYPPLYSTNKPNVVITGIAVIDVKNDGTGGAAEIRAGGIGCESVEIRLNANFWRGFSYQVFIIGRDFNNAVKDQFNNESIEEKETNEKKDRNIHLNINLNDK